MAAPAQPILASTLYAASQRSSSPLDVTNAPSKRRKLCPPFSAVGKVLGDGLGYGGEGGICCITGGSGSGAKEISQTLLIQHLRSSNTATATIIDTTLSFDVRKLQAALVTTSTSSAPEAREQATKMLGRVKIMKVFDFIGLTEGVAELRDELERRRRDESSEASTGDAPVAPRGTVGDSEDEEEMLDDLPNSSSPSAIAAAPLRPGSRAAMTEAGPAMLLIDNLTQVAAPLLKNNTTRGQALLTSFIRSLRHLTALHDLCTIVLNSATNYTNGSANADPSPSIFSSCTARPALGRTLPFLADLHLFVHLVPKTAESAEKVYGAAEGRVDEADWVSVVECLSDRYSERTGRWAPFVVGQDGRLEDLT